MHQCTENWVNQLRISCGPEPGQLTWGAYRGLGPTISGPENVPPGECRGYSEVKNRAVTTMSRKICL